MNEPTLDEIDGLIRKIKRLEGFSLLDELFQNYNGLDYYIAGGYIRRYLLNKTDIKVNDVDIFVNGDNFALFCDSLKKQGLIKRTPFGSIRWYPNAKHPFYYDIVHFNEINLGLSIPNNIDELLLQFDISINAVALNIRNRKFYNPFDALKDIDQRVIRSIRFDFGDDDISVTCPISPLTTLWFRIIHIISTINFQVEQKTLDWLRANKFRLEFHDKFKRHFFIPDLTSISTYHI